MSTKKISTTTTAAFDSVKSALQTHNSIRAHFEKYVQVDRKATEHKYSLCVELYKLDVSPPDLDGGGMYRPILLQCVLPKALAGCKSKAEARERGHEAAYAAVTRDLSNYVKSIKRVLDACATLEDQDMELTVQNIRAYFSAEKKKTAAKRGTKNSVGSEANAIGSEMAAFNLVKQVIAFHQSDESPTINVGKAALVLQQYLDLFGHAKH